VETRDRSSNVIVRLANLADASDQATVVELLDMYAQDPMGDGAPLADDVRQRLVPGLRDQPGCRVFLAFVSGRPIGLAICFLGYSTFRAKPLLNIHDLAVSPAVRGRGVGGALLQAVEDEARRCGCCRLTLEVKADNHRARKLYRSFGFERRSTSDEFAFWKKSLEE